MIRLDYYGVEGTGRTLKEAKADAGRKIETMLKGDYVPEIVTFRGIVALIWREPYGWYSKVITDSETGEIEMSRRLGGCCSHSSRDEALASTRVNLAQTAWTATDGLSAPEILNEREAREFVSWAKFQLKYQELKAAGLSETDCHRQACEAM